MPIPAPRRRSLVRSVIAGVAGTLGVLLTVVSLLATWVHTLVEDTDAYVATVAPLAQDPAIQQAITNAASDAVLGALDLQSRANEGAGALATQLNLPSTARGLLEVGATALAGAAESRVTGVVENVVTSPQFATAWEAANRLGHDQVVARLTGQRAGAVTASDGVVSLDLAPIVAAVREALVARGVPGAGAIPDVQRTVELVQSEQLATVQSLLHILDVVAAWLPWLALALLATAVVVATRRWRAVAMAAFGFAVAAALVLAGLALAVGATGPAVSGALDILLTQPRTRVGVTAVVALAVGLGIVATGWYRRRTAAGTSAGSAATVTPDSGALPDAPSADATSEGAQTPPRG